MPDISRYCFHAAIFLSDVYLNWFIAKEEEERG
jgi:hypothetical protein